MKKIALICLIAVLALVSFGCGGDEKEVSKKELVMLYQSLNNRYIEIVDFYEALQTREITKFNWRIIADSAKNSSLRTIETVKSSDDPIAQDIIKIAENIVAFTEELEGNVNHGTEADMSYKEKIQSGLDELKPEINKLKDEILKKD